MLLTCDEEVEDSVEVDSHHRRKPWLAENSREDLRCLARVGRRRGEHLLVECSARGRPCRVRGLRERLLVISSHILRRVKVDSSRKLHVQLVVFE